ncbi:MAG: hypothetical protein ACI9QL_003943, partial [Candidatus Omnitrophota bacterium]
MQFLCEEGKPGAAGLAEFARLASADASPVVRLYLAAALQRLPFEPRWSILEPLASHKEDIDDHNIPRMLWLALRCLTRWPSRSLPRSGGILQPRVS